MCGEVSVCMYVWCTWHEMCDVYMFVHLGVEGSMGLLWPGKLGMGALWPLGITPSPPEVTVLLHHLWLPRMGLLLSVGILFPSSTSPALPNQLQNSLRLAVLLTWQNCYATLISPLGAKWGKWCTLSGTWPGALLSSWSQWPERPCSKACSHRPVGVLSPVYPAPATMKQTKTGIGHLWTSVSNSALLKRSLCHETLVGVRNGVWNSL